LLFSHYVKAAKIALEVQNEDFSVRLIEYFDNKKNKGVRAIIKINQAKKGGKKGINNQV